MKCFLPFVLTLVVAGCSSSAKNEYEKQPSFQVFGNKIIVSGVGESSTERSSRAGALSNIINQLSLYCGAGIEVNSSLHSRAQSDSHNTKSQMLSEISVDSVMRLAGVRYLHQKTASLGKNKYRTFATLYVPKMPFNKECKRVISQNDSLLKMQFDIKQKRMDVDAQSVELQAQLIQDKLSRLKESQSQVTSTKSHYLAYDGITHPELIKQAACQEAHNLAVIHLSEIINGEIVHSEKMMSEEAIYKANLTSKGHVRYRAKEPVIDQSDKGVLCTTTLVQNTY